MHSTAVLHSQPFQLGYPPTSSGSDCIGSQRNFSHSAAFTADEGNHSRRVGSIGHSLSESTVVNSNNSLAYSERGTGLQDVQFTPASGGLLMSPTDGTSADNIVSNSTSIFPHQVNSWTQRMADFPSPPRIPTLHPATIPTSSLQGSGLSQHNNHIISRDNYPGAYSLSRTAFQSPPASLNEFPRYSYNSGVQSAFGTPLDTVNSMYPYLQSHRSGQLHHLDAPPFSETESFHTITANNQKVTPSIVAKIHKGFFQVDEKWTCYRRNYFSVTCSFTLQPSLPNANYFLQMQTQHAEPIHSFAMSISAVVSASQNEVRELVQHTPKRDKQSERKPDKVVLRPQQPYYLTSNITAPGQYAAGNGIQPQLDYPYNTQQPSQSPTQYTFERIQFQKATANNGKRRAQQQYYRLVVELHAKISRPNGSKWVTIAKQLSDPMVVRGRSPGHYKDGRRDSSASMGDSGGPGNAGDAGRGMLPLSIDHQSYSQMQFLYEPQHRGDQYSNSRDMTRHQQQQQQHPHQHFGQIDHSAGISPLVSGSEASMDFIFSESMGGHDSTDSSLSHHGSSRYLDNDDDDSLRRDSGSTGSSNQSHVPSLDLSSSTASPGDASHTLDATFDPMISSYHSEQEDGPQYLKHTASERLPLASIVNDSNQCNREGGSSGNTISFPRFDPIQESLCA